MAPHPWVLVLMHGVSWEREPPLESSGPVPLFRTGHPGLAEGWWVASSVLAKQLKEKGSRKEGETEKGKEREREKETVLLRGCC